MKVHTRTHTHTHSHTLYTHFTHVHTQTYAHNLTNKHIHTHHIHTHKHIHTHNTNTEREREREKHPQTSTILHTILHTNFLRERESFSVCAYGGRERRQMLAPWNNNVRGKSIKRGNAICCEQQTDSLFLSFSLGAFERNVNKGRQGFHPYFIYL